MNKFKSMEKNGAFLKTAVCINFIVTVFLAIAFLMIINGQFSTKQSGEKKLLTNNFPTAGSSAENKTIASQIVISITDEGFGKPGFSVKTNSPEEITVVNDGEKPHSFVIDGLSIDSGAIPAGESKTVQIPAIENPQNYPYHSGVKGDDNASFFGILAVVK